MIVKEALDTLMSSAEYNFQQDGNKIVYDGNLEAYEVIINEFKRLNDELNKLKSKIKNQKYLLTIQGNANKAESAIKIVLEKYGGENIIIKHLPTLGLVDNDYYQTKLEKIGE